MKIVGQALEWSETKFYVEQLFSFSHGNSFIQQLNNDNYDKHNGIFFYFFCLFGSQHSNITNNNDDSLLMKFDDE